MSTVDFHCRLSEPAGRLDHFWEHTVGSCHAPLALRADWQAQLRQCREELGFAYVRFHGLLCDDVGVVTTHGKKLGYSFFNADSICDFLLSIGMKPFVELSFMPEALASGDTTVFHYRGNVTPPRSYKKWGTLVQTLVRHWLERYGAEEVRQWFFEVWNEPNQPEFWSGTRKDYFKLFRATFDAIKGIDGQIKVGGPATSKNAWISEFLSYCDKHKLTPDFVSTHHYPTDAVGNENQDTLTQLANSRRSILREQLQETHRKARGLPVYYTEWNTSSNDRDPLHDEPYAAAFIVKTVLEAVDLVAAYSFWTFTDIFEEHYFPSVPFHGGFGLLNLHGVPKPAYRAFEILHALGGRRLRVDGTHETVDAWVVQDDTKVTVVLTNHALPRHALASERVRILLAEAAAPQAVHVQRIDAEHANAKRLWQEFGEPEYLSAAQIDQLKRASQLVKEPQPWTRTHDVVTLEATLPPNGVAAITIEKAIEKRDGARF
jgi:xylan 1,4-beta-xylosidase